MYERLIKIYIERERKREREREREKEAVKGMPPKCFNLAGGQNCCTK